ncbi:MAG: hypothetical protein MJK04_05435, partial [Psychrosphaera sp.]|nr:hypothetical protein [Psychrosphaera sp.]
QAEQADDNKSDAEQALVDYYLGLYFDDKSEPAQAKDYFAKANNYWQQHPDSKNITPLIIRFRIANVHFKANELAQTVDLLKSVLIDTDRLFGKNHPQNIKTLGLLANTYRIMGNAEATQKTITRAYQLGSKILDPNNLIYRELVGIYVYTLQDLGQYQQAVDILTKVIDSGLTNQRALGGYLGDRATINVELGYYQRSRQGVEQAIEILTPFYSDSFDQLFHPRLFLAFSLGYLGEAEKAQQIFAELHKRGIEQWREDDFSLLNIQLMQAVISIVQKDFSLAELRMLHVKSIFDQVLEPEHVAYIVVLRAFTELHVAQQQWVQALPYITRALGIVQTKYQDESLELWVLKLKQAQALWHMGKQQQAKSIVETTAP